MAKYAPDASARTDDLTALSLTMVFACIPPPLGARALGLRLLRATRPDIERDFPQFTDEFARLVTPILADTTGEAESLYRIHNRQMPDNLVSLFTESLRENRLHLNKSEGHSWTRTLSEPYKSKVIAVPSCVAKLESFRTKWDIDSETLAMMVEQSDWATDVLQRDLFAKARAADPQLPDRAIFRQLLNSRNLLPAPVGYGLTDQQVAAATASLGSVDEFCAYLHRLEASLPQTPDPTGLRTAAMLELESILATIPTKT
jgi:hypothetical protein